MKKSVGWKYAEDVVCGKILASQWVIKACQRALDDLKASKSSEYPWEFRPKPASHIVDFCQYLPHVKGEWAGEPFKPEPWQKFVLEQLFGWRRKTNLNERRFRECILEVARKNGKSFFASVLSLYELIFGDAGAEIYSVATKSDQAKLVWTSAVQISQKMDPQLSQQLNKTVTSLFNKSKFSSYKYVGRDSSSLDGLNPSLVVIDESAAITDRNLIDVMTSAVGARLNPLIVHITTAQFSRHTAFYDMRTYLQLILDDKAQDDRLFGMLYSLEEDEDWTDPLTWIKANPNLNVSAREDHLQSQVNKALNVPSEKNAILVKHFNIYTTGSGSWMDTNVWEASAGEVERTGKCFIGMDLAHTRDLCAISRVWVGSGKYDVDFMFWLPEKAIKTAPIYVEPIYRAAIESGILRVTPGDVTNYDEIQSYIEGSCKQYDVAAVSFDPYNATQLVTRLEEQGLPMLQVNQSISYMSPAAKETERLILENMLRHDGNRFLAWQLGNCEKYEDINGNIKIRKGEDAALKVDGIIALIMAISAAAGNVEENNEFNFSFIEL